MATTKENLRKLSQIFTDTVKFIVPDYQRGYSWGKEQLDALWEDLENLSEPRSHYTGMFTFSKNEAADTYDIVDGQQRMTTLVILINEMLSRIDGGIAGGMSVEDYRKKYLFSQKYGSIQLDYRFQYSVDNPSDVFFKTKILCTEDTAAFLQPEDTLYTKNLKNANNYFAEKLSSMTPKGIETLFLKVTEQLLFNEYLIEDVDDVYVTFETMNNRGKQLSTLELLKNRLIYLTTLYAHRSETDPIVQRNVKALRTNINNAWKTIYEYLGKSTKKILNDDSFLKDHWIMYFRYDRKKSKAFKKDLLSEYFTAKKVLNNVLKIETINDYVRNLQKSIVVWFNVNCPEESSLAVDTKEWLTRLNRVGIGSFRPLLMAAYLKQNSEDVLPLVKACERFRFLVSSVSERRSNTADSHFYSLAHAYFESTVAMDLVANVNTQTTHWTNVKMFINNSAERYQKNNGFYSWKGLRYFLYEYEKHLQGHADVKVQWEIFENNQSTKVSIEHIYPQTPTDEYWTSRFTTVEHQNLRHSLGNLLLLSKSKNSALQNDPFTTKKHTVRDDNGEILYHGYDNGSYSEIAVAAKNDWTPDEIVQRGKEMLSFMLVHWNVNQQFSNEDYNKLLNISNNVAVADHQEDAEELENAEIDDDVNDSEIEEQ